MGQRNENNGTRERLLNEAEIQFAQRGYRDVSIRDITNAVHCNLAAVNYHFGNKKNLYLEVFRTRWMPRARRVQESFKESYAAQGPSSPSAVVKALAQAFLEGPLTDEERVCHAQLMAREMAQPSEAFAVVADQVIRPFFEELADKLRPFLPAELGDEGLMLNVLSIFAQVLYFNFARIAVSNMVGREYDREFRAQLMDQIIHFSLRGLDVGGREEGR
jgi:AcrR family transcriptional regulator